MASSPTDGLRDAVASLDLESKVRLLTGQDFWTTWADPRIGLRSLVFSDGPAGVRGVQWDEREPSLSLPSGSALGATWDADLARRYGRALAREAIRKEVDIVLGPTVNLQRSPLGGRHFESFSEDPELTGVLAAAYVEGVQSLGVAATPKHYVGNEAETDRFTADSVIDERALREVYLRPFEMAVIEGRAWALMSAYNSINGTTASESVLLETPLRSEWGFDGVVVSDWTAVRSIDSAKAEQDLAMPGPFGAWTDALVEAVRRGDVEEEAIDRKVVRLLRLAQRVGAMAAGENRPSRQGASAGGTPPFGVGESDGVALAREVETKAIVLARNDGVLPLADREGLRIAVIGQSASVARTTGGGSATVIPQHVVTPLEGIRLAYPHAAISHHTGALIDDSLVELPLDQTMNPVTGQPGTRVSFLDDEGQVIHVEDRLSTRLVWLGSRAPLHLAATVVVETVWTPEEDIEPQFGVGTVGDVDVSIGDVRWSTSISPASVDIATALLAPTVDARRTPLVGGVPVAVRVTVRREFAGVGTESAMSVIIGLGPAAQNEDVLLDEAERAAREADAVVLVVGTTSEVESEGADRVDLSLPGRQDELARRVLAANDRTIVVVNSGAPVLLPWQEGAAAVLLTWFGGQEYGAALGDILTGASEPGGRLAVTWPASLEEVPVLSTTPTDGRLVYSEGIHVGYRAWLKAERDPQWAFGHGLGYSEWSLGRLTVEGSGGDTAVRVQVVNAGSRRSRQVAQVYVSRPGSAVDRPVRWLAAFSDVELEAGASAEIVIPVPRRAFEHWGADGWQREPGSFTLAVGFASDALTHSVDVDPSAA